MTKRKFPDMVLRRRFTEDQKAHFVSTYLSEGGTTRAARVCGVTPQIIWKYAKSAGVLKDYFKTVDHDYFSVIDCERKAYWLGMLMADGNVCDSGRNHVVSLTLCTQDADHVRQFRSDLGSTHALTVIKPRVTGTAQSRMGVIRSQGAVSCRFNSPKMIADLAKCGIGPRKTFSAEPWDGPPELMRHYWRGALDGDGCISHKFSRNRYGSWVINLVGSLPVVTEFGKFCERVSGSKANPSHVGRRVPVLSVCGNKVVKVILDSLYGGIEIALPRKWEAAKRATTYTPSGHLLSEVRMGRGSKFSPL